MVRLDAKNLTKVYDKKKVALREFSYTFTEGIYGLLGPNGAGKSTLIHLLTGNLLPDGGAVFYNKKNIHVLEEAYKKHLGYMPQGQAAYSGFSLERFLYYMASLKGVEKKSIGNQVEELIKRVNLEGCSKQKLSTFSGGMLQRALLAQALLGAPEIIILDEPTAGLDPKERIRIRNLISEIAFDKVVLIATHVVSDIEYIAKKVILLKQGELLLSGSPSELLEGLKNQVYEITCDEQQVPELCARYKVANLARAEQAVKVRVISKEAPVQYPHEVKNPTLEDLYLYYFDEENLYESKNV